MKEIYLILYHNSNFDSLKQLIKLIDSLKQNNKKFIISSHSSLPEDIIKEAIAYVYDSDNIIIKSEPINYFYRNLYDFILYSPFIHYGIYVDKNYGLASFKNALNGLNLAYQLGYDIVHSIEYDCIPDFSDLEDNTSILYQEDYSAVIYEFGNDCAIGSVFTIKLNDLNTKWIREYWEQEYQNNSYVSEKLLLNTLIKWFSKDKIKIKPSNEKLFGIITSFKNLNLIESVIFEDEEILKFYIHNPTEHDLEDIEIYFSSNKIKINLPKNHHQIIHLGDKESNKFVIVIHKEKIYKNWDISTEENYIKYVKPNRIETQNKISFGKKEKNTTSSKTNSKTRSKRN